MYKLICPDCGHDADRHCTDGDTYCRTFGCKCDRTAASLYAAECTRLALECERSSRNEHATVEESVRRGVRIDTLTAERDRYKVALEQIANADYRGNRSPESYIARTALNTQENE